MNTGTTGRKCAQCDTEVPPDALWGLCAKCLYDQAAKLPVSEGVLSAAGRRFGDYELGEALGRGGMGVVYAATQISLHRRVAVKMILDTEAGSTSSLLRFKLEAEAAAKLDHPNIVPIYEVGEHDGQPFLTMKLIVGDTLRKLIASGDLCLTPRGEGAGKTDLQARAQAIVQLIAVMARAVQHAHENGVLHRDLKPANILVDRKGQPHLTDFGLAKLMDAEDFGAAPAAITISGTVLGSVGYMSPEQAAGKRASFASDIYSLGAILYEMLAGRPPFQAGTVLETLRLVAEQQPRQPSNFNARIDQDLNTICLKCLEKNPASRYPSAAALADDLERWLRHEPIRARQIGPALRLSRWVRRNRVGTSLILSLTTALILALGLLRSAREKQRKFEEQRTLAGLRLSEQFERTWSNPKDDYLEIHFSDLATLSRQDLRPEGDNPLKLTFAVRVSFDPVGQAQGFAPVIRSLEEQMEKRLGRRVFFNLRLHKIRGINRHQPIVEGQVDFMHLGPIEYIRAHQAIPELAPVVQCHSERKEAVLFASAQSGITSLAGVRGHTVAFAHTNSIISFLAKMHLAQAGLLVTNYYGTNLDNLDLMVLAQKSNSRNPLDVEIFSHRIVLQEVLVNVFDVGVSPSRHFDRNKYQAGKLALVELKRFQILPDDVFVPRRGLEPAIVAAFREAMVSLGKNRDLNLGNGLGSMTNLKGFVPCSDADFDGLRQSLTNLLYRFDEAPADGGRRKAR